MAAFPAPCTSMMPVKNSADSLENTVDGIVRLLVPTAIVVSSGVVVGVIVAIICRRRRIALLLRCLILPRVCSTLKLIGPARRRGGPLCWTMVLSGSE